MRTNRFGENGEAETQILDCPLDTEAIFVESYRNHQLKMVRFELKVPP